MYELQMKLLSILYAHNGKMRYIDLLNCAGQDGVKVKSVLVAMRGLEEISGTFKANSSVELLPAGYRLLSEFGKEAEQRRYQEACEKAKERRNAAQALVNKKQEFGHNFLVTAFGVLFTHIVKYLDNIVQLISALFH